MSAADSKKVVIAALAGNVAICVSKFVAAYFSGSTATLAEAVHSVADTGNQALLLVGMRLAAKPPDARFPFGRAAEKYFWPFIVALMLFSVGGAFALYEGITKMLHGPHEHGSNLWSYGVLGLSLFFETLSFRVAWKEFKVLAKGKPWWDVMLTARDPTIPLVLAEDASALFGLSIAFAGVGVSDLTGQAFWDPLGSILIGALLCVVAFFLARLTHGLLIGEAASTDDQKEAMRITEEVPGVVKVTQLLAMHVGPDVVILAMKVAFRPEMKVEDVEETTDEIERRVRAKLPQMRKIFIEADSKEVGPVPVSVRASASRTA
jgi:cation diffusion facilitator family transporter